MDDAMREIKLMLDTFIKLISILNFADVGFSMLEGCTTEIFKQQDYLISVIQLKKE